MFAGHSWNTEESMAYLKMALVYLWMNKRRDLGQVVKAYRKFLEIYTTLRIWATIIIVQNYLRKIWVTLDLSLVIIKGYKLKQKVGRVDFDFILLKAKHFQVTWVSTSVDLSIWISCKIIPYSMRFCRKFYLQSRPTSERQPVHCDLLS